MEYGPKYIEIPPLSPGGRQARVKVGREKNYFLNTGISMELQEKRKIFGWKTLLSSTALPKTPTYDKGVDFSDLPAVIQAYTDYMIERVRAERKNDQDLNRYLQD